VRIIAGAAKGRRLTSPGTSKTRPATDRVREAVFSMLGAWVVGADVLDLYAGSGSYGLEALSRGARSAIFVESSSRALEALRTNVEAVGLGGTVVGATVQDFLARPGDAFDLVFVDPPWPMSSADLAADLARLDPLIAVRAEIIVSRRQGDQVPRPPENWRVAAEKRYGDTKIIRYEKEAEAR